MDAELDTTWRT